MSDKEQWKSIVAVDDCDIALSIMSDTLSDQYNFVGFTSTEKALSYLTKGHHVDLITTGLRFSGAYGLLFACEAQSLKFGVPILFLSGNDKNSKGTKQALDLSATAYLEKPFLAVDLIKNVGKIIERHPVCKTIAKVEKKKSTILRSITIPYSLKTDPKSLANLFQLNPPLRLIQQYRIPSDY